jgi:hypothetical protein
MPLGPQRKSARGTVGHPYSALNLRLVLALFGLVTSGSLAAVSWVFGYRILAVVLVVLAVTAAVDLVVIELRRRARRRAGEHHSSLFE